MRVKQNETMKSFTILTILELLSCSLIFIICNVVNLAGAQQEEANQTTLSQPLRAVVPVKPGFGEFANVKPDPVTGEPTFGGFSVDIFKSIINTAMPYSVSVDIFPFQLREDNGTLNGTYDDMLKAVSSGVPFFSHFLFISFANVSIMTVFRFFRFIVYNQ